MSNQFRQHKHDGENYIKVSDIVKWISPYAEFCRKFITDTITESSIYKELMDIPFDEIPLRLNEWEEDSAERYILNCRLQNLDPIENDLCKAMEILWNIEFQVEDYRGVGRNDGQIDIISSLFDMLGMKEESSKISEASYSD